MADWEVDQQRVLTDVEVAVCLSELRRKAKRSKLTHRTLIIFELATCCGLRVSEICSLTMADVRLGLDPAIRIRRETSKSGRPRTVPLGWDALAMLDVSRWVGLRLASGASSSDLLLPTRTGHRMDRSTVSRMYSRACRPIGRHASIHVGRHTFISWALHRGVDIQAVRAAVGHSSLNTTSKYAHVVRAKIAITDLFSRPLDTTVQAQLVPAGHLRD